MRAPDILLARLDVEETLVFDPMAKHLPLIEVSVVKAVRNSMLHTLAVVAMLRV